MERDGHQAGKGQHKRGKRWLEAPGVRVHKFLNCCRWGTGGSTAASPIAVGPSWQMGKANLYLPRGDPWDLLVTSHGGRGGRMAKTTSSRC